MHLKETEKIKNIGLTNFDTVHLADLIEEGAPIVSNQVTYYECLAMLAIALNSNIRITCRGGVKSHTEINVL